MTASQLAIAVVGSSIHAAVLVGDVGSWLLFDEYSAQHQAAFAVDGTHFDAELAGFGTNFDTLLRRVYLRLISTEGFRTSLESLAAAIARQALVDPLLEHLAASNGGAPLSHSAASQWTRVAKEAVTAALVLKCEISCAREQLTFRMARSGEQFDAAFMSDTHDGNGEYVAVGLFPGLFVERCGRWGKVCKALVRTT